MEQPAQAPESEEQPDVKRVKETLIAGIMGAALEESPHANAWLNRDEIHNLRRILGIPGITSARIHKMPRKKLEKLPTNRKGETLERNRLSILIGENIEDVFVLDHDAKDATSKKMPFQWKGMTIFYQKKQKPRNVLYFQTPEGVAKTKIHEDDIPWIKQEAAMMESGSRLRETFYLRMKQSGKELDPKHFDKKEQAAFQASDQKEWASWLKNKTVRES